MQAEDAGQPHRTAPRSTAAAGQPPRLNPASRAAQRSEQQTVRQPESIRRGLRLSATTRDSTRLHACEAGAPGPRTAPRRRVFSLSDRRASPRCAALRRGAPRRGASISWRGVGCQSSAALRSRAPGTPGAHHPHLATQWWRGRRGIRTPRHATGSPHDEVRALLYF